MLLEHAKETSVQRKRDRHTQAVLDTHSTWGHPDRQVHPIYYRMGEISVFCLYGQKIPHHWAKDRHNS